VPAAAECVIALAKKPKDARRIARRLTSHAARASTPAEHIA